MIKTRKYPGVIIVLLLIAFTQCKKEKYKPVLPAITANGANTFGCKLNENVFVPRSGRGKPGLFVQYENLGTGTGGGWVLNIPAIDWQTNTGVSIETDSLLLKEGMSYEIGRQKGMVRAFCIFAADNAGLDVYNKLDTDTGSLRVQRFDQVERILSGTFSFSATNSRGKKMYVTDGRFDVNY